MKCGYAKCKFGWQVSKEDGVKFGSRWFHKECNHKREVKSYCADRLSSIGMISKLTNIFLSKIIDDENCDVEYLKFTIDHIINNNLQLKNPYGVKYYMADWKIEKLYSDKIRLEISKSMSEKVEYDTAEETIFIPPQSKIPTYLKII